MWAKSGLDYKIKYDISLIINDISYLKVELQRIEP